MHDWTLVSLSLDWKTGRAIFDLLNSDSKQVFLYAEEVSMFQTSRALEWGMSVSVNTVIGPTLLSNGKSHLQIEMQSGDLIEISAKAFDFPLGAQGEVHTD